MALKLCMGHMSQALVSTGESVTKGQAGLEKDGYNGQSSGVHLHFEVRGGKNRSTLI